MIYKKDKGFEKTSIFEYKDGKDIIILSPSLYWYKKLQIPTKNISKATKIASNILNDRPTFYDTLSLKKDEDGYIVYCYNQQDIELLLSNNKNKKLKVYFANEIGITKCVKIGEKLYLYPFGDDVVEVYDDIECNDTLQTILEDKNLVKPILNISNNQANSRFILWIVSFLILISFVLFSFNKFDTLKSIKTKIDTVDYDNKSGYEIKALIKKYKKIQDTKIKIVGI